MPLAPLSNLLDQQPACVANLASKRHRLIQPPLVGEFDGFKRIESSSCWSNAYVEGLSRRTSVPPSQIGRFLLGILSQRLPSWIMYPARIGAVCCRVGGFAPIA